MRCPECDSDLIHMGSLRYQTLSDHVNDPNVLPIERPTYGCPNMCCEAYDADARWTPEGEYLSSSSFDLFKDKPTSAKGTESRRIEVEVYKTGLIKNVKLHPCFMLWFYRPVIDINYTSDLDGNASVSGFRLEIWKIQKPTHLIKERRKIPFIPRPNEYIIGASFWTSTWKYLYKQYKLRGKVVKSRNRRFPHRSFEWFCKNFLREEVHPHF